MEILELDGAALICSTIQYTISISGFKNQEEARVREGGAVLCSFVDWFLLLLVACLLACLVSLVSLLCVIASYLHRLLGLSIWSLDRRFVVV